jgi:Spy/CpxP family protein refolding chaperone
VHAAAGQDGMEEDVAKIFEDIEFKQRQSKREDLKSAMEEVKELVDDDLEF